jgi:hypothetical protein
MTFGGKWGQHLKTLREFEKWTAYRRHTIETPLKNFDKSANFGPISRLDGKNIPNTQKPPHLPSLFLSESRIKHTLARPSTFLWTHPIKPHKYNNLEDTKKCWQPQKKIAKQTAWGWQNVDVTPYGQPQKKITKKLLEVDRTSMSHHMDNR